MKYYVPDYYAQFRCIADRCKHSCCIGWEIDIDPGTLETYRTLPGDVGEALRRSIVETEEGAHFRLTKDERCPMLMENGLCRLICAHGEESLCQICADHPRFRNFFPNRTEMGLGLCCEAAAELILRQTEKVQLICPDQTDETAPDDETTAFLAFRDQLIATAQNRSLPLKERMEQLLQAVSFSMPGCDFLPLYRSLEQLDPAWDKLLSSLPSLSFASLPACPA
ncbi:MAG: flagellin lysine-N-methylase, partial [Clostridia bacterium]|nr:flagellin lysine-N-methylase [Clostridia bacterium]